MLDEVTAFIEGPLLPLEDEDAYLQPAVSEQAATVYEHCVRALESGRPVGAHGLPLMGGGDWNDGMNRVGHEGTGESVWLAWFLDYVLERFAPVCESRGDAERAADYRAWAARLAAAVEATSWDGAWYRRAYFDDGTPLGTHDAEECRIDAIAQAWATISGAGDPERAATALDSVEEKLVRREDGLIALLTPPFDHMARGPRLHQGLRPRRARERRPVHARRAVGRARVPHARRRRRGRARCSTSSTRSTTRSTREAAERYVVEPYVVAADVYAVAPHIGRGGWTWYTGSASWFYRVALRLAARPPHSVAENGERCTSSSTRASRSAGPASRSTYRHGAATYRSRVENPRGVNRGVARVERRRRTRSTARACRSLDDGAEHEVVVTLLGG